MIELQITMNSRELEAKLNKAGKDLDDLRPTFKQIGAYMISSIDKNFREEGRPKKWKPLSQATIAKKGSSRILQDTGALKNSIAILKESKGSITIGVLNVSNPKSGASVRKYGEKHQEGGVIMSKHGSRIIPITIPQRKFIMFQTEDVKAIKEFFRDEVRKILA